MSRLEIPVFLDGPAATWESETLSVPIAINFSDQKFDGADELLETVAMPILNGINQQAYTKDMIARKEGVIPEDRNETLFNPTEIQVTPIIIDGILRLIVRSWHETEAMPRIGEEPTTVGIIQPRESVFELVADRNNKNIYLHHLEGDSNAFIPLRPLDAVALYRMADMARTDVHFGINDEPNPEEDLI